MSKGRAFATRDSKKEISDESSNSIRVTEASPRPCSE
jgi:hypothetical protein